MAPKETAAKRWIVRGRVQGVGFRYFAQREAHALGLAGYARNLHDGRVEVYACGPEDKLSKLAASLHKGPNWADVRGVDEIEAVDEGYSSFVIN